MELSKYRFCSYVTLGEVQTKFQGLGFNCLVRHVRAPKVKIGHTLLRFVSTERKKKQKLRFNRNKFQKLSETVISPHWNNLFSLMKPILEHYWSI